MEAAASAEVLPALFAIPCFFFACYGIAFAAMFGLIIASMVIWIWMIIDVVKRPESQFPGDDPNTKMFWMLIVILAGVIGAVVYYFMVVKPLGPASPERDTPPESDASPEPATPPEPPGGRDESEQPGSDERG